jgi:hypothetical protein
MLQPDCDFKRDREDLVCTQCGQRLPWPADAEPPRRNCPQAPSLAEGAQRLGISWDDVGHYAAALARWTGAGFPTRADDEVARIAREHCNGACDKWRVGRCVACGCNVNTSRFAVWNKIRMATENCPLGKW